MNFRLMDPLEMTPQERRRRIVELLAVAFTRWTAAHEKKHPRTAPKNSLASSAKSL